MTPCERLALEALTHVSFGMDRGRYFAHNLLTKPAEYELTARQKWNLGRLAWRYRRQLPREISDWALEVNAGMGAPVSPTTSTLRVAIAKKTRFDKAREVLARPLQFGDLELKAANRLLGRRRR